MGRRSRARPDRRRLLPRPCIEEVSSRRGTLLTSRTVDHTFGLTLSFMRNISLGYIKQAAGLCRTRRLSLSLLLRIARWNARSIRRTGPAERATAWTPVLAANVHRHLRI